jgi:hypothetical protein
MFKKNVSIVMILTLICMTLLVTIQGCSESTANSVNYKPIVDGQTPISEETTLSEVSDATDYVMNINGVKLKGQYFPYIFGSIGILVSDVQRFSTIANEKPSLGRFEAVTLVITNKIKDRDITIEPNNTDLVGRNTPSTKPREEGKPYVKYKTSEAARTAYYESKNIKVENLITIGAGKSKAITIFFDVDDIMDDADDLVIFPKTIINNVPITREVPAKVIKVTN